MSYDAQRSPIRRVDSDSAASSASRRLGAGTSAGSSASGSMCLTSASTSTSGSALSSSSVGTTAPSTLPIPSATTTASSTTSAIVPTFIDSPVFNMTITLGSASTAVINGTTTTSVVAPALIHNPVFNMTIPVSTAVGIATGTTLLTSPSSSPAAVPSAFPGVLDSNPSATEGGIASPSSASLSASGPAPGFLDSPLFNVTATLGALHTIIHGGSTSGFASVPSSASQTSGSTGSGSSSSSSVQTRWPAPNPPNPSESSVAGGLSPAGSSSPSSATRASVLLPSFTASSSSSTTAAGTTTAETTAVVSGSPGTAEPTSGASSLHQADNIGLAVGLTSVLLLGILATAFVCFRRRRSRRSQARNVHVGDGGMWVSPPLLRGDDGPGMDDPYSPISRTRRGLDSSRSVTPPDTETPPAGDVHGMEVGAHYDADTWGALPPSPTTWSEESASASRSPAPSYLPSLPLPLPPATPDRRPISAKGFMRRLKGGQASRGLMTTLHPVRESESPVPEMLEINSRPPSSVAVLEPQAVESNSRPWIHRTRSGSIP